MGYPPRGTLASSTICDPDMARFIGAFLGDGWTRNNGAIVKDYSVGLSIGRKQEGHTVRYLYLAERLFPGVRWKNNALGALGITCSSKVVYTYLREIGVGQYCEAKAMPAEIFFADIDARLALLAGYMDADGHVVAGEKNLSRGHMGGVNLPLIEDLRKLAIGCGLCVTPVRTYSRVSNICPQIIHQCWISGFSTPKIPMWHDTKFQRSKLLVAAQEGRKIKRTPKEPY